MERDIKDDDDIKILVDAFYRRAAMDDLLGPIFLEITDSGAHKEILYTYWSKTLLQERADPCERFPDHIELMFSSQHFIRWLTFFLQTIDLLYSGPTAERAKVIVIKRSEEFQSKLALSRF